MVEIMMARANERTVMTGYEKGEPSVQLHALPTTAKAHALALPLCQMEHKSDPELTESLTMIEVEDLKEEIEDVATQEYVGSDTALESEELEELKDEPNIFLHEREKEEEQYANVEEKLQQRDSQKTFQPRQRKATAQERRESGIAFMMGEKGQKFVEKEFVKREKECLREAEPTKGTSPRKVESSKKEGVREQARLLEKKIAFSERVVRPEFPRKTTSMTPSVKKESCAKEIGKNHVADLHGQRELSPLLPKEQQPLRRERDRQDQGGQQQQQQQQDNDSPDREKKRMIEEVKELPSDQEIKEELLRAIEGKEPGLGEGLSEVLAEEDPQLSSYFKIPVTYLDVLYLYAKILKLMIEGKKQERSSRREERILQLEYMDEVVKNFKKTANWLFTAGLTGGLLGLASGILPIMGHTKFGQLSLQGLRQAFKTMPKLPAETLFQQGGKICSTMSQMQTEMGNVQRTNAEADRFKMQHLTDLRRADGEENTRGIEDIKQEYRTALQVMSDLIRMIYEAANSVHGR